MHLFPERVRRSRRLILAAAVLSLLVHFVGGSLWAVLSRTAHKPGQSVEKIAKAAIITIDRLPPPTQPPASAPVPRVVHAPPPRHAVQPETPHFSVPSLAPQAEPTPDTLRAKIRIPRARIVASVPVPRGARGGATVSGGLTSDQIKAMDGSFRKTIAQAQEAVDATPAPVRVVSTTKDYNTVLHGSIDDIVGGNGICNPIADGRTRGVYTYYYLTCSVRYTDGYSESVSFPWPFKFTRRDDPFLRADGTPQRFPPQGPPDNFVLPHPFALSRAVCFYFREECAAVLARERAAGGPGG